MDGLSSDERSECHAQALCAFFALDARDESGGQCRVALGDVRRGGRPRRVGLPLGMARDEAVQVALLVEAGEYARRYRDPHGPASCKMTLVQR